MAKAVEEGAKQAKGVNVTRTYHATPSQLEEADAVAIGAPTYNHRMTLNIQQLLEKAAKAEVNLRKNSSSFRLLRLEWRSSRERVRGPAKQIQNEHDRTTNPLKVSTQRKDPRRMQRTGQKNR